MKIAFLRRPSLFLDHLTSGIAERLSAYEFVTWDAGTPAPATDLDVLLVVGTLAREQLARQSKLFFIQTTSAGYDGIDVDAATDLGIWVSSAPSGETGNAISVAEWAVFLMLGASRRFNHAGAMLRDPSLPANAIASSLAGKIVCIVGLGAIGRLLVDRLRPFEMRISGTDARPDDAPTEVKAYPMERLHEAVQKADYVVVCAPGTKENENLIDAEAIAAMKPGAILINVSRGSLVDEGALADAVRSGHIAAAGLDVLKQEPPDRANPLLALEDVLITPHIAGATDLMLAGTIDFVGGIVDQLAAGHRPKSVLNAPKNPRRPL